MIDRRWIVAVTGASGAPYALRLLRALVDLRVGADVIVSEHGWRLFAHETGVTGQEDLLQSIGGAGDLRFFDNEDRGARPASGSAPYAGLVICPCSTATLSAIAPTVATSWPNSSGTSIPNEQPASRRGRDGSRVDRAGLRCFPCR